MYSIWYVSGDKDRDNVEEDNNEETTNNTEDKLKQITRSLSAELVCFWNECEFLIRLCKMWEALSILSNANVNIKIKMSDMKLKDFYG